MLYETMIVLAKTASTVSAMVRAAFAHGHAAAMRRPRCGWLRIKLVAPTSQAAAVFYGRPFEVRQI
jgi:hypothetical protein